MSLLFFFDTETTGLPAFKDPSDAPHQPHLVQVAAALVDSQSRKFLSSIDLIVKPDGWEIPQEVVDIHGITTADAARLGVDESLATELVLDLWRNADLRVAHNQSFDARILRIALKRHASEEVAEEWKAGETYCTCYGARPHVKSGSKLPTLAEAYAHFTGGTFDDAHSARADMEACASVYFAMVDRGLIPPN